MSETGSVQDEEFVPLDSMPTKRLQDVVDKLDRDEGTRAGTVVNIEGCLTRDVVSVQVLLTILHKLKPSVKTLSLRFNNLGPAEVEAFVSWLEQNDFLECLYIMSSGIDDKSKGKVADAWKKNLTGHSVDNFGYTLLRLTEEELNDEGEVEED